MNVGRLSPELAQAAIDVAVARKGLDNMKEQGEAAVELIDSAVVASPPPVARSAGKGTLIDVYM
jgi:hypothetical protein